MLEPVSQIDRGRGDAPTPQQPIAPRCNSTYRVGIACVAAFAIGVVAMLLYRPFALAEGGDDAIWVMSRNA